MSFVKTQGVVDFASVMHRGMVAKVGAWGTFGLAVLNFLVYAAEVPEGFANILRWIRIPLPVIGSPSLTVALLVSGISLVLYSRSTRKRFQREARIAQA